MNGINKASRLLLVVLALAGWSLIPRISFTEHKETTTQQLVVSTPYPEASAIEVEEKITQLLEGRLNLIPEIENIRSYSTSGHSRIEISIQPKVDFLVAERKIRMMCRLESRSFPGNAGNPSVSFQGSGESVPAVILNITSDLPQDSLYRWLYPRLAVWVGSLPESERIVYPDLCQPIVEVGLNQARLQRAGITAHEVMRTLETVGQELPLAQSNAILPTICWETIRPTAQYLDSIYLMNELHKAFRLSQFIHTQEKIDCRTKRWQDAKAMFGVELYFHPGGWTHRNHRRIRNVWLRLEQEAVEGIVIEVIEDNLGNSLRSSRRILIQCSLSVVVLAILLLLTTGRRQAIFLLMLLIGSLGLSFLGLYVLELSFSVSVVGGLTLGLGMAADNGIMVLSSQSGRNRKRQILPLLAATLTTLVPLALIQWATIPMIKAMAGFGMALALMIFASLLVCWAALPVVNHCLVSKTSLEPRFLMGSRLISRIRKERRWIHIGLVLLIGIPVPELPERIYIGNQALAEVYRNTIGSYEVQQIWQPRILGWIGGMSRPFIKQVQRGESSSEKAGEELELVLKATAEMGTYPVQICELVSRIEQELLWKKIPGIRLTRCCGPTAESMITIRASRSKTGPGRVEQLYRWLITRIQRTSGIVWSLSGVGKGWSNEKITDQPWRVTLQGYQYVKLIDHAKYLADSLRSLPGVMEAYVGQPGRIQPTISYKLEINELAQSSRNVTSFLQEARMHGRNGGNLMWFKNGQKQRIPFSMVRNPRLSLASFLEGASFQYPDPSPRSRYLELDSLLDSPEIYKENQVYEVQLNWSYVGSVKMGERLEKAFRQRLTSQPLTGCRIKPSRDGPERDLSFLSILMWGVPVLGIMWVISVVFLESLRFAFLVLLTIPFGWIGAMAWIVLTEGALDAGALAGFFLVTGLSVNHAIFLLMPLRTMRRPGPAEIAKIYQRKMRPILLTMISTGLTFGPFCLPGADPHFWSSLAFITTSGLFTSVVLTLACLPTYLRIQLQPEIDSA